MSASPTSGIVPLCEANCYNVFPGPDDFDGAADRFGDLDPFLHEISLAAPSEASTEEQWVDLGSLKKDSA